MGIKIIYDYERCRFLCALQCDLLTVFKKLLLHYYENQFERCLIKIDEEESNYNKIVEIQ